MKARFPVCQSAIVTRHCGFTVPSGFPLGQGRVSPWNFPHSACDFTLRFASFTPEDVTATAIL